MRKKKQCLCSINEQCQMQKNINVTTSDKTKRK